MRRVPLSVLAALAAVFLLSKEAGRIVYVPRLLPIEARDSLNGWADLAQIHEKAGQEETCSWCHLEGRRDMARGIASDPRRWLASTKPASFQTAGTVGSEVCLSCHDGSLASAGATIVRTTLSARGASHDSPADHPIGMQYSAALSRSPSEYNAPVSPADIRLDAGRVGCTSCHLGHGRNGRLGGPFAVSEQVCSTCHIR